MKIQLKKQLRAGNGVLNLDVNLNIEENSFITIYGPSGAGKTSILRMISGLMTPDAGLVEINDNTWFNSKNKINIKPQLRSVGMVFQDYALFPNMSVYQNIAYGLKKGQDSNIIHELIDIFDLNELAQIKPPTLSGGQKQRVALARAIANHPGVLLLDEPLSALDYTMRVKLQGYLKLIHERFKMSIVLVSHDIGEVIRLSDLVFVLKDGQIHKSGRPSEIFAGSNISGKFQITGEVLEIVKSDVIYVVTVLCGNDVIKAVATGAEAEGLHPGDKVLVASKAFNPMIRKIDV